MVYGLTTAYALTLCEEINANLDAVSVLALISFHADKLQETGNTIKAFCPIHQDSRFRSLLVDAERKAFRCTIKTCRGYEGGSLVELYSAGKDMPYVAAAYELATRLKVDVEPDWQQTLAQSFLDASIAARNTGDFTQTEAILSELIAIMPERTDARIMLASLQADLGDPQAAAEEYVRLIEYLLTEKKCEEAESAATSALELFPDNEDIQFVRIRVAEESGQHALTIDRMKEVIQRREEAGREMDNVGLLEQLVAKSPYEPEHALKLAALYEKQHNVRGASRQYENTAKLYLAGGNKLAGIEMLERVVHFNNENVKARLELAHELMETGKVDEAREHTFKAINQQIDQQDFGRAVATIHGWQEKEPQCIEAQGLLARIALDQDRSADAANFLADGAQMAADAGDHSRSADLLLRAKFLTPDDVNLRRRLIAEFQATTESQRAGFEMADLAEMLFAAGESDQACALLEDGVRSDISLSLKIQMISSLMNHEFPEPARILVREIYRETDAGEPDEGTAELLELLVRLEPDTVENHLKYIEVLWTLSPERAAQVSSESVGYFISKDDGPKAEILLEAMAQRVAGYLPPVPTLIDMAIQCERVDLAGTLYQASIQEFADTDPEQALRYAQKLAEIDPQHSTAASDVAYLLVALGRNEEAAEQYARVALTLHANGDFENAYQYAREASDLNPASLNALAGKALAGRELLGAEELEPLANELLVATRANTDPAQVATGYLAYTDIYADNDEVLAEADARLQELGETTGSARIRARIASRHSVEGNWDKAAEVLARAADASPNLPDVWEQLGEALSVTGKKNEAASAYANAANTYATDRDLAAARRCVENAASCQPGDPDVLALLFKAGESAALSAVAIDTARKLTAHYREAGDVPSCSRWSREWVRLAAGDPDAHFALGTCLLQSDQQEHATDSFSTAANMYFAGKKYDSAVDALMGIDHSGSLGQHDREILSRLLAVKLTPTTEQNARLLLARTYIEEGNVAEARNVAEALAKAKRHDLAGELWPLIAAREINPERASMDYVFAAEAQVTAGKSAAALSSLATALNLHQSNISALDSLCHLLEKEGRLDEALPHALNALARSEGEVVPRAAHIRKIYGDKLDSRIALARTLVNRGEADLALPELEAAARMAIDSEDANALVEICSIDEGLTRRSTALTQARADALMGMENEDQAIDWIKASATDLLQKGNVADSINMAQKWVRLRSDDPDAHRLLASTYEAADQHAELSKTRLRIAQLIRASSPEHALAEVEKALEANTSNSPALRLKVDLLKAGGAKAEAIEQLLTLANLEEKTENADTALAIYREILDLAPDHPRALWLQAELLRGSGDMAAALPVYRQWLGAKRKSATMQEHIANIRIVLGWAPDNKLLLTELSDTLIAYEKPADAADVLVRLSGLLEKEGNYAEAAQTSQQALGLSASESPEQYMALAYLQEHAGEADAAVQSLRTGSELFLAGSDPTNAAKSLEKVIELSGDTPLPADLYALAKANHAAGNNEQAIQRIDQALALPSLEDDPALLQQLVELGLTIAPLNSAYIVQYIDILPPGRAMAEGLRWTRKMNSLGLSDDSIKVLTRLVTFAPHDMSLRQELLVPLRASGNLNRLRQELAALAADAATAGDTDAAVEAVEELNSLAETAPHYRQLGELNERFRRTDMAATSFTRAAVLFARDNKTEQAIASVNRAISAKPSAVSADEMAELVMLLREDVHDIAREQLRAALTARRQKHSQVLALALLETSSPERGVEILRTVNSLGGSPFLVSIARHQLKTLLDAGSTAEVLSLAETLIAISPDSPDAWHLAAKVYNQAEHRDEARRCALEAARLYQTAGAIIEEEDSYREAISATPGDLSVRVALADYLVREGRPDDSVGILQNVIEEARGNKNLDLLLETLDKAIRVAPGNTDLREQLATELENIAPDSAINNWLETARIYKEEELAERSLRIYEHVLKLNPTNETALQELLSEAYRTGNLAACARYTKTLSDFKASRKNMGEACKLLQNYLELDPHNLEILEKLAAMAGSSNNTGVFTSTTRALALHLQRLGNHAQALAQLEKLLVHNPRDMRLLMNIIDCCAAAELSDKCSIYAHQLLAVAKETEDPEKVRFAANIIINHEPENAAAHNDLGEALLSLNFVPEAVTEWLRAAELYEYAGNIAMAYTCYRRVTQVNPNTMQAWKKLADVAITIGDLESAKLAVLHLLDKSAMRSDTHSSGLIERLIKALPVDPQIHTTALEYYKSTSNADNAVKEVLWLAEMATKQGNTEYAEALIEDGLAFVPGNPELKAYQHNLIRQMGRIEELQIKLRHEAEQFEKSGKNSDAIAIIKELINLSPNQLSIHRELLRLYEKTKQTDEAFEQNLQIIQLLLDRSELEEARDISDTLADSRSKDYESRECIGDLFAQSAFPDAAARHYMAAAQIAKSKRKPAESIELLIKAVGARPTWIDSRRALAEACEKAGRADQAFESWIGLSSALLEAGEYAEAASTLDMLAKQRPGSPEVREQLSSLYERTGNRQKQTEVLKDLVAIYETEGDDDKTLGVYRKLIANQPEDPQVVTRYVELLAQNQSHTEELSTEYVRLADILTRQGDYEAAFQTYEQVIGLSPDNTGVRSRYAAFLMNRGSRNRALTEMRILADLYKQRDEHVAAVEVLNAALTISPRDADLCLTLAKAQEAAGFHEDARVSYARATAILASTAAVKGIDTYRRILTQDENNTAVRLRLVELLMKNDDKMEAAREARILAEIHLAHGQMAEAEYAYQIVDQCQPESVEDIKASISRDSYDPSLQYLHYVRLGNRLMENGDIDAALDTYRTARSLHDDEPRLIQKCIDCLNLISPEAEAIPDYLVMAEKQLMAGNYTEAATSYEHVRRIDPFNNDARCGLESVKSAERANLSRSTGNDNQVLKTGRAASKRVGLMDLLVACQEASLHKQEDDVIR